MTSVVVIASVSAAWFLPRGLTAFTERRCSAPPHNVSLPALWQLEVGNLPSQIAQRRKRSLPSSAAAGRRRGARAS